jgi:cellulose synthase/poly-beta-1,6-N-acetylglucosamine synthase-like glycosyltransferase
MVIGAVRIKPTHSFFSKLQVIEFNSLIGSAAATLTLGFPTMCNGANLAYRKTTFVEVNGFDGNAHIASGDDEFLMRKVVKKFGAKSLRFLKDSNAVVATNPQEAFKDFLTQRIRWASKWRHNSDDFTVVLSIFVLSFQFSWLIAIGSLFFQPWNNTILALVVVKVLTEGFLLFTISRFMRQKFYWDAFFVLQIVYPLYVIVVGIFSNVFRVSWKGRSI